MILSVRAHAKINWSLNVLSRRADGYHELDMLMQSLELSDELAFEEDERTSLSVGGGPFLPDDGENLVFRAARALNARAGESRGARIRLVKHIPARAGLGGGSADCAAALLALNRLWGLRLDMPALMDIGRSLGADVPFCMARGLARVGGVGEKIAPAAENPVIALAMVTPGGGLSTAQVFREWDLHGESGARADLDRLQDALRNGDLRRAHALSYNALEAPAMRLMPEIREIMDWFIALGAPFVRLTGSGSTVFAAFPTMEEARAAAARIPGATVTSTEREASWEMEEEL